MLTELKIKAAKATGKQYKLADFGGMFLLISATGNKWWRLKYRLSGKESQASLGVYPEVSLAQARTKRDQLKAQIRAGLAPAKSKDATTQASNDDSFEQVAKLWHEKWRKVRSEKHANQVWRRLELDVLPRIGQKGINTITAKDIADIARAVQQRGANDLAVRAIQISGQVFRYAVANGKAKSNPARDIQPSDVLEPFKEKNYNRVSPTEFPQLLRDINRAGCDPLTRLAIHLLSLTFVRTSELIQATWDEFDLEHRQWRIPAERMKMDSPHIVPLCTQAMAVIETIRNWRRADKWVFPGNCDPDKHMSNNTILFALYDMGYKGKMTGHGFRGVASTILHELGCEHTHIELQLAHQERNKVSAAYNWATYIQPRTEMMQFWADHLDKLRGEAMNLVVAT